MGARLTRQEGLRAELRGFRKFIEAEKDRLDRDVYEDEKHVHERIDECEERCTELEEEIEGDPEEVLDSDSEHQNCSSSDDTSDEQDDQEWKDFTDFFGNIGARVEAQLVEDLASEGIGPQDLRDMVEDYDEVQEELWHMYGIE